MEVPEEQETLIKAAVTILPINVGEEVAILLLRIMAHKMTMVLLKLANIIREERGARKVSLIRIRVTTMREALTKEKASIMAMVAAPKNLPQLNIRKGVPNLILLLKDIKLAVLIKRRQLPIRVREKHPPTMEMRKHTTTRMIIIMRRRNTMERSAPKQLPLVNNLKRSINLRNSSTITNNKSMPIRSH